MGCQGFFESDVIYAVVRSLSTLPKLKIMCKSWVSRMGYLAIHFFLAIKDFLLTLFLSNIELFVPYFQKVLNYHYLAQGLFLI